MLKEYDNPLLDKSLLFASRIVKLYQYLLKEKHESVISKQVIRSGTSIGANASEAIYGISKADFDFFAVYFAPCRVIVRSKLSLPVVLFLAGHKISS